MALVEQFVPFLMVAIIGGLILAQFLRGRVRKAVSKRARPVPKKPSHLHLVNKETMDRDLNELLKRK